jgi:hypothetical protein
MSRAGRAAVAAAQRARWANVEGTVAGVPPLPNPHPPLCGGEGDMQLDQKVRCAQSRLNETP